MIRKRGREAVVVRRKEESQLRQNEKDGNDFFRQHFESIFQPLPVSDVQTNDEDAQEDTADEGLSSEESEWGGLSDDDGRSAVVHIIEHSKHGNSVTANSSSTEYKAFMVSDPLAARNLKVLTVVIEFKTSSRGQKRK